MLPAHFLFDGVWDGHAGRKWNVSIFIFCWLHKSGLERVFYDTRNNFQRDSLKSIAWLKVLYQASPSVALKDHLSRAAIAAIVTGEYLQKWENALISSFFFSFFTFLCELKDDWTWSGFSNFDSKPFLYFLWCVLCCFAHFGKIMLFSRLTYSGWGSVKIEKKKNLW